MKYLESGLGFDPSVVDKIYKKEKTQIRQKRKDGESLQVSPTLCTLDSSGNVIFSSGEYRVNVRESDGNFYPVEGRFDGWWSVDAPNLVSGDELYLTIKWIHAEDVRCMDDNSAKKEGFEGKHDFMKAWCKAHDPESLPLVKIGNLSALWIRPESLYTAWVYHIEVNKKWILRFS